MKNAVDLKRLSTVGFLALLLLAGCSQAPTATPTSAVAVADNLPPTVTPTATLPPPTATKTPIPPSATPLPTQTPIPSATPTPTPTARELAEAATVRILVEGSPYLEEFIGAGAGVIIDPSGLALTNFHLVEGAGILQVTLADGAIVPAQVVGRSACDDVALLQLLGDLSHLPLGADPTAEDVVQAAGYALGDTTITFMELSVNGDPLTSTLGFADTRSGALQSSEAVDPGFTGGPLLSAAGAVAGILSIDRLSDNPTAYLIPSSRLEELIPPLTNGENLNYLGMNVGPLPLGQAENESAPVTSEAGLLVYAVDLRGPAGATGIRAGDVLISLAGESLTDFSDGASAMETYCQLARNSDASVALDVVVERGADNYLGQVYGAPLEKEVVELPPTATPAPAEPPAPAPTQPAAAGGGDLLEAMIAVRRELRGLGGFLDGLMAGGCLNNLAGLNLLPGVTIAPFHVSCIHQPADCQRILNAHANVVSAPRFDNVASSERNAYNTYLSAIARFDSGTTDLMAGCRTLIGNPDASISNLVVAQSRQSMSEAADMLGPAIESLQ